MYTCYMYRLYYVPQYKWLHIWACNLFDKKPSSAINLLWSNLNSIRIDLHWQAPDIDFQLAWREKGGHCIRHRSRLCLIILIEKEGCNIFNVSLSSMALSDVEIEILTSFTCERHLKSQVSGVGGLVDMLPWRHTCRLLNFWNNCQFSHSLAIVKAKEQISSRNV